ncbi:hypothetical protein M9H77_07776 [Catharanthus roseus]|uniref:Uncharacterized protein n=1 Tax=Catharanthus roseus TaxID=4058 RepID=A0ACC0BW63_CATRO|nr:hypothetical protein M9H77_07776 [Catharanthus roseus]
MKHGSKKWNHCSIPMFHQWFKSIQRSKSFHKLKLKSLKIHVVEEISKEELKTKEGSWRKSFGTILKDLPISLSLNHSLMCYGDFCAISFGCGLFLFAIYVSKCLSSHTSLEDPLMGSGDIFDPSYCGFSVLDDTALVGHNIVSFELDCALFDIVHDKCLGKFCEDMDYVFPFVDAFMKNLDGVILLNQCHHLFSSQFEFSYN